MEVAVSGHKVHGSSLYVIITLTGFVFGKVHVVEILFPWPFCYILPCYLSYGTFRRNRESRLHVWFFELGREQDFYWHVLEETKCRSDPELTPVLHKVHHHVPFLTPSLHQRDLSISRPEQYMLW